MFAEVFEDGIRKDMAFGDSWKINLHLYFEAGKGLRKIVFNDDCL